MNDPPASDQVTGMDWQAWFIQYWLLGPRTVHNSSVNSSALGVVNPSNVLLNK